MSGSDSDSDSDAAAEGREQRARRLRAFEPYFEEVVRRGGFAEHTSERPGGGGADCTAYILLCAAILCGDRRGARLLLRRHCSGRAARADPGKDVPLQLAVLAGETQLVGLLLASGARAAACFRDRRQPLHLVCDRRCSPATPDSTRLAIARLLLAHDAEVDAPERRAGDSPLILAVRSGCAELASLLVRAGADRSYANRRGETALHAALTEGAGPRLLALLCAEGAPPGPGLLAGAARRLANWGLGAAPEGGAAALAPVRLLLRRGVAVDASLDARGNRLLHLVCQNRAARALPLLLRHGADVDARNDEGRTPLHFCAEAQPARRVALLLERGADVGALTRARQSVLHFAAANRSPAVLELLLRRARGRLRLDATSEDGLTPLFCAVWAGRRACARLLLDWGARVDARVLHGQVVLHVAVDQRQPRMVELLLERGADLGALDDHGNSPLSLARCQATAARADESDGGDSADSADSAEGEQAGPRLGPTEAVRRALARHGARLFATAPRLLGERGLRALRGAPFQEAFDECLAELERVKRAGPTPEEPLGLLRLLAGGDAEAARCARDPRFLEAAAAVDFARAFPIYGGALGASLRRAVERLALLERCCASLDEIARGLGERWLDACLPRLVAEHILQYLSLAELRRLASIAQRPAR
ncbi:ankyrin repeat domain-containing protein 65-like [Phymastichus coffea]|uniref:ankyrin repeat domain-containing protein 65-like n=1 Tax=Phymastichus coffea TaxID=108790 RepID=UPI00273B82F1|nr:ankyrin repeat domain-containing protein 65-like [Phymastichus coffea]